MQEHNENTPAPESPALETETTTTAKVDTNTPVYQFKKLIDDYGLTGENNIVHLKQSEKGENGIKEVLKPFPIFELADNGISIMPYSLQRYMIQAPTYKGSRFKEGYRITRLHPEVETKKGLKKYHIPAGAGTPPFFPVQLLKDYEAGNHINTLYITEGYKKAFKACNVGLPCVGLISITCMIDKATEKIHADIVRLIDKCQVKRVVWLIDADFREITKDDITETKELATRPNNFYKTICKFHDLLSGIEDIGLYFAHIHESIEGNPKGLDDLLIEYNESTNEIIKEANQFNKINKDRHEGNYFVKFNITQSPYRVRKYFFIDDVTQFYLHHTEKRPELKGEKFKFFGTLYKYSEETGKCEIEIPKDANNYFRVGDDYYEYIQIPNRYGELTKTFHNRQKSTIRDDHGSDIIKHIPKYKAFCNVPNHLNYQRVINGCFNTYAPFLHEPEDGDCEMTLDFLKHIFGSNEITLSDGKTIQYYELGLDYLQLLIKRPYQILPILCLVSKERQTGKTTFAKWLKLLFTENMAIVGNQDFENSFNAHWISKLLVCVDETKIDKEFVVEKIKSLSTSSNTMLNAKGKNQVEVETFLKFILLSNNEDNFINIDKEEIRFWVLQIPSITERVLDLEKQLLEEIPAFLNFLNKRKMVTKYEERHWFKTDYLQTEILQKIKENSQPSAWKILRYALKEKFEDFPDYEEIKIPLRELKEDILRHTRYDEVYLNQVLKQQGYIRESLQRGNYPLCFDGNSDSVTAIVMKKYHGRPFVFKREDFTNIPKSESENESDLPF